MQTHKIKIKGQVQAVGFRPFIYQEAKRFYLVGTVSNNSNGVEIIVNSTKSILDEFIDSINTNLPPLAKIDSISVERVDDIEFSDFKIIKSKDSGKIQVNIPPDISICQECQEELLDPNNRRYGYPFINCTNCGVRYSIIYDLPYDRANTAMRDFDMCKSCEEEYNNPLDRRYHAEPIGCWDCGARLDSTIDDIVKFLLNGDILAIKGVGGYHLVCDATNDNAVQKLRDRKNRPTKPFAVMVKDMKMAKEMAYINAKEEELLTSKERPIVIVGIRVSQPTISPNISRIGLFLPYTPLHLLILEKLNHPIVATSANITDEPIATTTKSIKKLSNIYDYLVNHNRDIVNGCDDSVVMVVENRVIFIRRARGYTPVSIKLPFKLSQKVLAVGANQKSTVAIGFDNQVILSPHIGDLDGIASVEYFRENIENLKRVYHFEPNQVIYDKHPNYESSKYAKSLNIPKREIQHHYAHILSVIATNSISYPILGVAFDGTGYGDDGNLWGGEFLLCDRDGYNRVAHIKYFKLLGGAKAIKEPRRVALSLLFDLYGDKTLELDNPTTRAFSDAELNSQYLMWQKGLNSPLSSSVGRLFDGVTSLCDICQIMSFEGESGMRMEEYYDKSIISYYHFDIEGTIINILPMVREIIKEKDKRVAISKFFNTLVEIIYTIYKEYNLPLALSGGVFQNRVLLELLLDKIPTAYTPNRVPPNDGGVALGQVVFYCPSNAS